MTGARSPMRHWIKNREPVKVLATAQGRGKPLALPSPSLYSNLAAFPSQRLDAMAESRSPMRSIKNREPVMVLATAQGRGKPLALPSPSLYSNLAAFPSQRLDAMAEAKSLARQGIKNNHTVFDLETYSLMYKIPETDIVDILCGSQALLVMKENRKHLLSLGIKQIDSGDDISFIYHPMEGKLELLEIFHEKILIKERSKGLLMIDAKKQDKKEVPIGLFEYHPLYGRNCFLTFQKDSSQVRTLNGSVVKELDSALWKSQTNEHMICSSSDDDTIIYLAESKASEFGCVNVCSLGREVFVATFDLEVEVSCLSYNEDLNEIYVGTSGGRVYVYSV
ncbi:hypothetical protein ACQ4PT_030494 [Festuca glaucescens]